MYFDVEEMTSQKGNSSRRVRTRCLIGDDGRCEDNSSVCYPAILQGDNSVYFLTYEGLYRNLEPPVPEVAYVKKEADDVFGKYLHLQNGSSFDAGRWRRYVARAFPIEGSYKWRPAAADERLFHRRDGHIGVSVELLRAGLRFPLPKFLIELFVQQFKCAITQFSPNAIRWILWYIAACHRRGLQPTFKDFFALFTVRASGAQPFFELAFCSSNSIIGSRIRPNFKPLILPKTMKTWQNEFLFVQGADLPWLPGFSKRCEPGYRVDRGSLSEFSLNKLIEIAETFLSWTEKDFFENNFLRHHNCMFLFIYMS